MPVIRDSGIGAVALKPWRHRERDESTAKPDMKHNLTALSALAFLACLSPQFATLHAQGTAFTYQGRLNSGGTPANGRYDLTFALYDEVASGAQQGGTLTNTATAVSNGLFTVTLDFGNQFPGADRWLELGVQTNGGGAFTTLAPRQKLAAAPYAITAGSLTGPVAAGQLTGTLPLGQLPEAVLTNGASSVLLAGTFAGNGAGVSNVNLLAVNTLGAIAFTTNFGNFTLSSSPGVGMGPQSITAADVNGDGRMDLVSANTGANSLTVLTNSGSGGFVLAATLAVGLVPQTVVAADVNGDGMVDLIAGNFGPNTLTVLTNTPSYAGVFTGDGSDLTSLSAANLSGIVPATALAGAYSGAVNFSNVNNTFTGNGGGLTNLNPASLTGTLADAQLSPNVALLNRSQTFAGSNLFSGSNIFAGVVILTHGSNTAAGLKITTNKPIEFGAGVTKELNAGKIGYQTFTTNALDIVGAGTNGATRRIHFFNEGGAQFDGAVGIGTNAPAEKLHVLGNILASGTVTGGSDRNIKRDFAPVNSLEVLRKVAALPISTWTYVADDGVRHLGPMSQDFYSAFAVGLDDKHISMVDADGVALAAIQGLNEKVEISNQKAVSRMEQLEVENAELKARLARLEQLLNARNAGHP